MSAQAALFAMPDPLTGQPTRGEFPDYGITQRAAVRIGLGYHPLECVVAGLRLHPDASCDVEDRSTGPRCKGCVFAVRVEYHNRSYRKCAIGIDLTEQDLDEAPRASHSEQTDLRLWWPACRDYQPSTK